MQKVFLFLKRMNESTQVSVTTGKIDISKETESHSGNLQDEVSHLPKGGEMHKIDGPFFFRVSTNLTMLCAKIGERAQIRIIRTHKLPFLSGVNDNVRAKVENSKIPNNIGEERSRKQNLFNGWKANPTL